MSLHRASALLVAFVAAALLVAADRAPAALQGTWQFDADKMIAEAFETDPELKKASPDERKQMEALMRDGIAGATLTFGDGKMTFAFGEQKEEADYKLLSHEGDTWKLESTEKKEGGPKVETVTIHWVDDDHITIVPDKEEKKEKLHLVRKK